MSENTPCTMAIFPEDGHVILQILEHCDDKECPDYRSGECTTQIAYVNITPEQAREFAFLLTTKSYEVEGEKPSGG